MFLNDYIIKNVRAWLSCIVLLLFVSMGQTASAQYRSKYKPYTGKRAWWYNYQYFPALEKIDINPDSLPDLQQRLSFFIGGGYAGLRLNDATPDYKMKWGGQLGARYTYLPCKHFGFRTGLDLSYAQSDGAMDAFSDYYWKTDQEHDRMRYDYSVGNVDESYTFIIPDVPVELVGLFGHFSVGLGMKLAVPFMSYKQTMSDLTTSAYYEQYDVLVDNAWMIAAGHYDEVKGDNKFTRCQVMFIGTAEIDYDFKVNSKYSLAIGAYLDYSASTLGLRGRQLSSSATSTSALFNVTDEVPVSIEGKSFLAAQRNDQTESIVSSDRYFNAGIKVTFNLNWYGPEKPKTKPY